MLQHRRLEDGVPRILCGQRADTESMLKDAWYVAGQLLEVRQVIFSQRQHDLELRRTSGSIRRTLRCGEAASCTSSPQKLRKLSDEVVARFVFVECEQFLELIEDQHRL